ncbi:helix-turn-helix domain-containing protein [Flagellimonas myxillae]|uniref:helix-turn-helix domain-containing protein n=1 Tax=Flagellimonas myxillae TaxID=2942214 RepID=UPI00201EFC55|nr:helix-turn-helix domain-containing protein [Muricauda myxillae]MCL6266036.1 helix-turn-helix domain-containing protein [Muricauda myxillae]
MLKLPCIISCLLTTFVTIYAQESAEKPLMDLDYDEIKNVWIEDLDAYKDIYFDYHIAKAKKENDTLQWAHAYRYLSRISDLEQGINYIDTSIAIAQSIQLIDQVEFSKFMALAMYSKAAIYYLNYVDEQAVEAFIESYRWAKKSEDIYFQSIVLSEIANVKAEFGQENEAILLLQRNLKFLEQHRDKMERWKESYLQSIHNMARCYAFARETDSARVYVSEALELLSQLEDQTDYESLITLEAQLNYYDGRFETSRDTLKKYVRLSHDGSKADKLFYLAKIEEKIGSPILKREYYEKYDSIMASLNYPFFDNANEVYQGLLQDAIERNDQASEKKYLQRLIYYDSVMTRIRTRLQEVTLKDFDIPMQMEEKSRLTQKILSKNKLIYLFYALSGILLVSGAVYYLKYRNTKKKLTLVMSQPVKVEQVSIQDAAQRSSIDPEITKPILDRLNTWEIDLGFLDSSVSQHSLAKILDTNSSYLSQTINHSKGQNFASYLKDLRITYAINDLKANPKLAKSLSMIQIAEHYGFNSIPVFAKSLKKKIGVTPGAFIKQVGKESGVS